MTSPTHPSQSRGNAYLYVAVEPSANEWLLTMSACPGARPFRARVRPGDGAALQRALATGRRRFGLAAEAPVRSCYEAVREGFWPHR